MTAIEWKSDWRPSEMAEGSFWWVRRIGQEGTEVAWMLGDSAYRTADSVAINHAHWILGPPCRIGDAAEVQRLRGIIEKIAGMSCRHDDAHGTLRAIYAECEREPLPERQETGQ